MSKLIIFGVFFLLISCSKDKSNFCNYTIKGGEVSTTSEEFDSLYVINDIDLIFQLPIGSTPYDTTFKIESFEINLNISDSDHSSSDYIQSYSDSLQIAVFNEAYVQSFDKGESICEDNDWSKKALFNYTSRNTNPFTLEMHWKDKTGYVGIRILQDDGYKYGWIKVKVNSFYKIEIISYSINNN